jgi:uncharacterized membrane protein YcaP (DUF421 family)
MASYASVVEPIPWIAVLVSALQSCLLYWLTILCVKLIGVHVVGQTGPQYLAFLLLFTTGMSSGLSHQQAGFWGSVATALALTLTMILVQHISPLKKWIHGDAMTVFNGSEVDQRVMSKTLIDPKDLEKLAHSYGLSSVDDFSQIILENDGRLTGITKHIGKHQPGKVK